MRLSYKILCIDDKIDSLEEVQASIKAKNDLIGISTEFVDIPVVRPPRQLDQKAFRKDIYKKIEDTFKAHGTFDLIMIDFHMQSRDIPNPIRGPELIRLIRNHTMYLPIVFYSGGIDENDGDVEAEKQLEKEVTEGRGNLWRQSIMICPRGNLKEFLTKILNQMHREEHKINNARGVLMDSVSELDALYSSCFENLWKKIPEENQDAVRREVLKRSKESVKRAIKACRASRKESFKDIPKNYLSKYGFCDLNDRLMIIRKILQHIEPHDTTPEMVLDIYDSQKGEPTPSLSKLRNNYAHQKSSDLDDSDERYTYIRKECSKHLKHAQDLFKDYGKKSDNL